MIDSMAHFFFVPPAVPANITYSGRRQSTSKPQPPESQAEMDSSPAPEGDDGVSSGDRSTTSSPTGTPAARSDSVIATHRAQGAYHTGPVRTRSIPGVFGSAGVVFERAHMPASDDDVIIVTVRLTDKFRKSSVDGANDLPSRPPRRSFLRRLSTRVNRAWDHSAEKEQRYKAVKMPRAEYKRFFRRDKEGNYAGSEPEREWDEEELARQYGAYQEIPLHSVLC